MQYQSERFNLPDAELRCLLLFGEEKYLTAKGIAARMNVVKSRVSKIIEGLEKKALIRGIKDPEDSRITLLSLTKKGRRVGHEIDLFLNSIHREVLLQIPDEQRNTTISALEILKTSMEVVKERMVSGNAGQARPC